MSYQVLARKYRPRSFDTLVGQEHVVRALTHALDHKRLHHAWLFTGTRGVGKTTLSRILAKALNCRGADGNGDITSRPCGVCEACVAIDAGRFVDYIEMDAASNRGVDEMAQLLEQAIYAPTNARFKVYMIDEVHMLTNHAFNAMLKTLEEPPEHVKFILATTDPQKIPVTVLSRCLQFNLKQMPPGHIVGHLQNILQSETIGFDVPALRLLAQAAHGSMRDALSLTDQAIAYAAGTVSLDAVQGMLGALDQSYLVRLLDALAAQDGAGMLAVADELAARSLSWNGALQDLGSLLHQIALAQMVPTALSDELPAREDVLRLAGVFDPESVQLWYQIVVHGRNELGLAPDEYAGFTMTLLRMLAFRPEQPEGGSVQTLGAGSAKAAPAARSPAAGMPVQTRPASSAAPAAMPAAALPAAPAPSAPVPAATSAPVSNAAPQPTRDIDAPPRAPGISPARAALEAARGLSRQGTAPASRQPAAPAQPMPPTPSEARQADCTPPPQDSGPPPWDDAPFDPPAAIAQKKTEPDSLTASVEADVAVIEREPSVPRHVPTAVGSIAGVSTESADEIAAASAAENATESRVRTSADSAAEGASTAARSAATPETRASTLPIDWPGLVVQLPLRGVVQQLAMQSELIDLEDTPEMMRLGLRIPLDTLRSAGSVEKLVTVVSEHVGRPVRIETTIGTVRDSAHARAEADRAARQREAESAIQNDPFVQTLMREFGATVVPGSVKPI